MLKPSAVVLLILFLRMGLSAQGFISGVVVDSADTPVPFAIVALLNASDSSVVTGTPTDENGQFVFAHQSSGSYRLRVAALGYEEQFSEIIAFDTTKNTIIPVIHLNNPKVLDEVAITAVRPAIEFRNGNTIVNVENSVLAKGNTVFDLLSKLPGVSVDKNVISIQGKSGVIVMIDNRVQHMTDDQMANLLRGMSAETVARIEILRNPPSKYDAAGTSGMINIITKKNTQVGFTGSVFITTAQGVYNNSASGLSVNYKNEKLSIFSSVDGSDGWFAANMRHYRYFAYDSGSTLMCSENKWKERQSGLQFKLGADWLISRETTIGCKVDGGPGAYTSYGTGSDRVFNFNNTGFDHLYTLNYIPNKWNIVNYNVNASHLFDTSGTHLDFSADFTNGTENDKSYSESHFYDVNSDETLSPSIFQNRNNSQMQILSGKLDFAKTIDSVSDFECGVKISSVSIRNDYMLERKDSAAGNFYTDTDFSNKYDYTEQTYAAYLVYSTAWEHFSMKLGIRAEETVLRGENSNLRSVLRNQYFNVFPDVSLEYAVSETHVFVMNVNRRINRPVYDELNSFVYFQNPFSYYQGNPLLQPDYSYKAELSYSFSGWLINSLSYEHIDRVMLDYTIQNDSTKIFLETIKNMKSQDAFTYSLFVQRDIQSWWSMVLSGNLMYIEYNGDVNGFLFHTGAVSYYATVLNTLIFPRAVNLEIMGLYRGPNLYGTTNINPVWMVSAAVRKSFFHDHLSCSFGIDNIFNSMKFHTHAQFDNQKWDFYYSDDSRRVNLSISYNFGTANVNERDTNSNEDEKGRLDL